MNLNTLFSIANLVALVGWIALCLRHQWRRADRFVVSIIAALLSLLYAYLLATGFRLADFKSFGSLDGIAGLFQNRTALLAGWVHYLAFDLMTGLFLFVNAAKHRIPHWIAIICGFFTFMTGPVGLLLYLIIRTVRTRRLFAQNW